MSTEYSAVYRHLRPPTRPSVMIEAYLGEWHRDPDVLESLKREFESAWPFPHVVIDDFLQPSKAGACCESFPPLSDPRWHTYFNPLEIKLSTNDTTSWDPVLREVFGHACLQNREFLRIIRYLTGIDDLENDPHAHGGGLHCHPMGGKLDVHLDYGIHPISGMERRLNLILYLNPEWKEEYGGDLQLCDGIDTSTGEPRRVLRIYPMFNRAVLFRTSDESWHGMPTPLTCPEHLARQSMAIYYVSEPRGRRHDDDDKGGGEAVVSLPRLKASFVGPPDPLSDRLREIRKHRRITADDLGDWRPSWRTAIDRPAKSSV